MPRRYYSTFTRYNAIDDRIDNPHLPPSGRVDRVREANGLPPLASLRPSERAIVEMFRQGTLSMADVKPVRRRFQHSD